MKKGIQRRTKIDITESLELRFWDGLPKREPGKCWEWNKCVRNGYGAIKHQGRVLSVHRVSYAIHFGLLDDHLVIGHRCDNKLCCNPEHLEQIDQQSNIQAAHNRSGVAYTSGRKSPHAKLSKYRILYAQELVSRGESISSVAARFNVNPKTLWNAINRKTWSHLGK